MLLADLTGSNSVNAAVLRQSTDGDTITLDDDSTESTSVFADTDQRVDVFSAIPLADGTTIAAGEIRHVTWIWGTGYCVVAGSCESRNEKWNLQILGTPTGGTFTLGVTINGTLENLEFDYDFTAAEVKTELATHSEAASTDFDTSGGPLPGTSVTIEFIDELANTGIEVPQITASSLTGGTGVGVLVSRWQPGYPN